MAKPRILSLAERKAFQAPVLLQEDEQSIYFELTDPIRDIIDYAYSDRRKVGFILQWGYFRRAGRFFSSGTFHKQDIIFVSKLLEIDHHTISLEEYTDHPFREDQQKILGILGFSSFNEHPEAQTLLSQEITRLVQKQIRPKMIIYYLAHFFFHKKIETPSYQQLAEKILDEMEKFEIQLLTTLENNISKQQIKELDKLLPKVGLKNIPKNELLFETAPISILRELPLSSRPGKIKRSVGAFLALKKLFREFYPVIQALPLSPQSLKYYAIWVQKAKISQLLQIKDPYKRYLYLLAFITHQYYYRQDLLVDTVLQIVQSILNIIEKKQQEADKNTKKERDQATQLLSKSYHNKTELLNQIQSILHMENLSAEERVKQLKLLLAEDGPINQEIIACIEKLDKQVTSALNQTDFYNELEKQSLTLQKRLSKIIQNLDFNAVNSTSPLLTAINHFRNTEGDIGNNPPRDFLDGKDLAHVVDPQNKKHQSLYKALLFVKIAEAIKSGAINLIHSYRYLSIEEYLINKKFWLQNRQDILERAELTAYSSATTTIAPLKLKVDEKYHHVNKRINSGENPHVSFNKIDEIIVDTPKVEKIGTQQISELLKQENYISILDVLNTVDKIAYFTEPLQHYSVVQKIKRPEPVMFYAGLIGKGCNIGLGKLASVSKGVNGNILDTVVNWYFSNDNLMAANNRIINFINKLALPNEMKRVLGKLHTSSDGQKRNVDLDSLLANFSFKYHGSGRGVSIYDFIDERHVLFHTLVMSSAEREAAYVIDGLMFNDAIKSDIHSTDTHGYSDLIFAVTHLLGISFAPRLAKLKKRALYSFESRKSYKKKDYKVLPDETINMQLIEDNWDDILRLVATIKLKEATASQIFKRLSSYAKDNPLYQGLKEFGKLIKTIFLLTYIDDLELRQSIQKQLNKIELSNRFSSAVFFDNNQEFKQGSREEQEIAMSCKILLQNAIILWNYLYLSQLLATTGDPLKREELLKIIQNGSIMTWAHINLLGEYDFRNKAASNKAIFDLEKILAWKRSA